MRLVQRGADQIVHRGVDDDEILGVAGLHIDHAGDQDAGIADDHPPRLEHQRAAEVMRHPLDHRGIGVGHRRRFAIHVIGNAEAAAEIDMRNGVAVGAQRLHEFRQHAERGFHPAQIGDLAADMHVDAGHLDPGQLCRAGIDRARAGERNAELVLGFAGGDLGMGAGIDVGIDPNRDPRRLAGLAGEPRQQFEFRLGFDVDAENVRRPAPRAVRLRSCRRRRTGSCPAECRRPARASTRRPKPRRRRRRVSPACAAPTGWNWPSWRSRPPPSRRRRLR